jgi:hypothetical protein
VHATRQEEIDSLRSRYTPAATRCYGPASMFAKTLRHLGVPGTKILEVVGRLAMWIGPVPAAEAAGHIQRALREYDGEGAASTDGRFPGAHP